jgi:tRNA (guanine-N7-)-methyltransferase
VGKGKLQRFKEMDTFKNVFQPGFEEIFNKDFHLKSFWQQKVFNNTNPIVLELGCGKGEYTIGLARRFSQKNFIGVDIKGARMWKGAKEANTNNMNNVAFLRTRIEFINSFFSKNEISEIWITFPDPQIRKSRSKKRLTASRFLNTYKNFLQDEGIVHLKTDSVELYEYTQKIIAYNGLQNLFHTNDLYKNDTQDEILCIRTFYEQMFLDEGKKITYTKFRLSNNSIIKESSDDE